MSLIEDCAGFAGAEPQTWGTGRTDHAGPEGDAGKVSKAIKVAAQSAYGTAGPEFVRRLIAEGVDDEAVRGMVADFTAAETPPGADGQIGRAAERLGDHRGGWRAGDGLE